MIIGVMTVYTFDIPANCSDFVRMIPNLTKKICIPHFFWFVLISVLFQWNLIFRCLNFEYHVRYCQKYIFFCTFEIMIMVVIKRR